MPKKIALIFAGGTGSRMGNQGVPKQFLILRGKPIIVHTIEYFQKNPNIDEVIVCCVEEGIGYLKTQIEKFHLTKVSTVIPGGTSGQDSIYRLLVEARTHNDADSIVLIHDGVRPFINQHVINKNIASVEEFGTSITCTNCYETIITSPDGIKVNSIPYRKETYAAQAPQSFILGEILDAHEQMRKINPTYENIVDSCTLYHVLGKPVHMIEGNKGNIKVTYPEDFYSIQALFDYRDSQEIFGVNGNDEYFTSKN